MSSAHVDLPRRPAVPVMLYALIAIVICMRAVLGEAKGMAELPAYLSLFCAVMLPITFLGVFLVTGNGIAGLLTVVTMAGVAGVVVASFALQNGEAFTCKMQTTPVSNCSFRILSDPSSQGEAYRYRAEASCGGTPRADVWLTLPDLVEVGSVVRCVGRFERNDESEWGRTSREQGVWGSIKAVRMLDLKKPEGVTGTLGRLRAKVLATIKPNVSPERALLAGCVCGWRLDLRQFGLDETFSSCGVAHMISVSGSHLAVVGMLVSVVLAGMRMRPAARVAVTVALCGAFVLMCGAPVSAVRSMVMTCSTQVAGLVGRRSHALSGLSVAGVCMALLDPGATGQAGFLLSLASVAGLCIYSPYVRYVIDVLFQTSKPHRFRFVALFRWRMRVWSYVCNAASATVVAELATLPLVAQVFGKMSLVGLVVNLLVSPAFVMLMAMGLCVSLFIFVPALSDVLLACCDLVARYILIVCTSCSRIEFATVTIDASSPLPYVAWALLVLVLVAWPRVERRLMVWVLAFLVGAWAFNTVSWRLFAPARICVLDVGQGDAILIQEGASTILVDAGPGDAVVDALRRNNVSHIDALVITHLHEDHYSGIEAMKNSILCDRVFVARGAKAHIPTDLKEGCLSLTNRGVEELSYGDELHAGTFTLRVVWPQVEVEGDQNSESIMLLASYSEGERTLEALLTGDAEAEQLEMAIRQGDLGDIDFLKAGHHGSQVSITSSQAKLLDPEVSVASAGEGNAYGHPTEECIDVLEGAGSLFLCTKDVGDVEVMPDAAGPTVRYRRDAT